jgi:hypothetical protein
VSDQHRLRLHPYSSDASVAVSRYSAPPLFPDTPNFVLYVTKQLVTWWWTWSTTIPILSSPGTSIIPPSLGDLLNRCQTIPEEYQTIVLINFLFRQILTK